MSGLRKIYRTSATLFVLIASSATLSHAAIPAINQAAVNYTANTLTIGGTGLLGCDGAGVYSIDFASTPLSVQTISATSITAAFPASSSASSFGPGSHLLSVAFKHKDGHASSCKAEFSVAMGRLGPEAPHGVVASARPIAAVGISGSQEPQGSEDPAASPALPALGAPRVVDAAGHSYPLVTGLPLVATFGNLFAGIAAPTASILWQSGGQTFVLGITSAGIWQTGTFPYQIGPFYLTDDCSGTAYLAAIVDPLPVATPGVAGEVLQLEYFDFLVAGSTMYYTAGPQQYLTFNSAKSISPDGSTQTCLSNQQYGPVNSVPAATTSVPPLVPPLHIVLN
jgi:hypothetical protein